MRVSIKHREETSGVLQNQKQCYLDCQVEFSEEERSIIKERDLYRDGFTVRTSTPVRTMASFGSTIFMRLASPFIAIGGLVYGIVGSGPLAEPLGTLLIFGGIGLFIYSWFRRRREDKRLANDEQFVTIKQLLSNPIFTVHAWNAHAAKGVEEELREHLASLKSLIKGSAELRAKQTFEL